MDRVCVPTIAGFAFLTAGPGKPHALGDCAFPGDALVWQCRCGTTAGRIKQGGLTIVKV